MGQGTQRATRIFFHEEETSQVRLQARGRHLGLLRELGWGEAVAPLVPGAGGSGGSTPAFTGRAGGHIGQPGSGLRSGIVRAAGKDFPQASPGAWKPQGFTRGAGGCLSRPGGPGAQGLPQPHTREGDGKRLTGTAQ